MALVSLLSHCDNQEKLALLNLFSLMAKDNPSVREKYSFQLGACTKFLIFNFLAFGRKCSPIM